MLDWLLRLKEMIGAEYIIEHVVRTAGPLAVWVLAAIVFAETGLLVGFFLPGDSLLFLAGIAIAADVIPTPFGMCLLVLIIAAIVGDQTGYLIGKQLGTRLFTREESWLFKPKYVHQTKVFYDKHGAITIIIGRFMPFVRTFAPMIAGVAGLEYRRFVVYNVVGGVVWITSMLGAGYFLGSMIPKKYLSYVTVGIILISVAPVFITLLKERINRQKTA
jgi:membrane-associated protein